MRAAGDDATTPPEDPAALRALLLAALGRCDALAAERDTVAQERDTVAQERDTVAQERDTVAQERDALAVQNERLRHLLARLKRMQFGRKSERLPDEQLHFAFEEIAASVAANEADAEKRSAALRRKRAEARRAGRGRLPAHLPRVELVLEPEDTACPSGLSHMALVLEGRHCGVGGMAGVSACDPALRPPYGRVRCLLCRGFGPTTGQCPPRSA